MSAVVTGVTTAAPSAVAIDNDDVYIDIIPGVITVNSAYHIDEVNILAAKIIRACLALCLVESFNVVVQALFWLSASSIIWAIFMIGINYAVYYLSVQCVKRKNERVCCNLLQSLTLLRVYMFISVFLLSISVLVLLISISFGGYIYDIYPLIINTTLLVLSSAALKWSNRMADILNYQVHIAPTVVIAPTDSATTTPAAVTTAIAEYRPQPPLAVAVAV